MRKWIQGGVIERTNTRSYKVKTVKGGVYVRNRKLIRIKYTDSRQSLQATKENSTKLQQHIH